MRVQAGVAPGEVLPAAGGEVADAASDALGLALRVLGPAVVLSVLPLGVRESLAASAPGGGGAAAAAARRAAAEPARTWLLPLLRRHVAGAPLAYWGSELLVRRRPESEALRGHGQAFLREGRTGNDIGGGAS